MGNAILVLLRHGKSEWNESGRFTGWEDVDLSPAGVEEAAHAGELLQRHGYSFDVCFTSVLLRATRTADIVLQTMGCADLEREESWRLNERHYGALQGLNVWTAIRRYGVLPVMRCKREFDCAPPALERSDPRFPGLDPRYAGLDRAQLPITESLKDTLARLWPYWQESIVPQIVRGRRVLIVSHKNVLRGLLKHIEGRPDSDVKRISVGTGKPLVFKLDAALNVVDRRVLRDDGTADGGGAGQVAG